MGDSDAEDAEPAYLANEAPLLRGLRFHLKLHAPFRPLLALLSRAVAAGVGGASADAATRAEWDGLQARSLAVAEAALALTPLVLLLTPVEVAAAALLAATAHSALSLIGAGGLAEPLSAGASVANATLWPALSTAPTPEMAARAAAVAGWLRDEVLTGAGAHDRVKSARDDILRAMRDAPSAATARVIARLYECVEPAKPARAAREVQLRTAVSALKARKAEDATAAAAVAEAIVRAENVSWGVVPEAL